MKKSTTLLIALLITGCGAFAQRITVTVAGTGTAGFTGDGASGKFAQMSGPFDICLDALQNIYFTDFTNGRVRMISARTGVITTVAGGGSGTVDGIPATTADISPRNMCIDAGGNIYITSSTTHQVKRVDAVTNIITTVAGTGSAGFSGDGGPATAAAFNDIYGICTDAAGNLYIVDQGNFRIRKVSGVAGTVTTIAGTATSGYSGDGGPATDAQLYEPFSITVNAAGDVFFMDQTVGFNSRLRKISASSGVITTIAGGPSTYPIFGMPLLNTWFGYVTGLCMTGTGDFYCNEISCSCRKIDMHTDTVYPSGGNFYMESFADNKNSDFAYMDHPYGIAADGAENLYTADNYNNRIRKLMLLTHTPTFAYGKGQYIYSCTGFPTPLDSVLAIVDLDSMQTETWTVVSAPLHGTLSGFPATQFNTAPRSALTKPVSTTYSVNGAYSGLDSFQVQVSDGSLSSIFTVYVSAQNGLIAGPDRICAGTPVTYADGISGGLWAVTNANASISSGGIVSGASAGNDSLTYTVSNYCGSLNYGKPVAVDIAAPADAGVISGGETVCAGSTLTLGETLAGGTWSLTNTNATVSVTGVLTGTGAGTDNLVYTYSNGCGSATSSEIVNILPLPDAGSIRGAATACKGSLVTLTDLAPGGIWSSVNGHCVVAGAGLFNAVSAGLDTLIYSVTNTCGTATATQVISITNCTANGVPVTSATSTAKVFPNPASSVLNIDWEVMPSDKAIVSISDITGRVVMTDELISNGNGGGSLVANLAALKDGIYLLSITSGSDHFTDKLMISKQ